MKKILRLMGTVLLIVLASFGVGMTGIFLPTSRERYRDVEIKIEQVDKKEEEGTEKEDEKN